MSFRPDFGCNNMDCPLYGRSAHWLPYPNPPKTKPDPKPWPTDAWKALFLCPECKQVRIYTKAEIAWHESTDEDYEAYLAHAAWFCAKFECAVSGCETPVELHVLTDAGKSIQEVDSMLRSGDVEGELPCGHQFVPSLPGKFQIVRESYEKPIRSYAQ